MAKLGKPKGSRNKKTLERLAAAPRSEATRTHSERGPSKRAPSLSDIQYRPLAVQPGFEPHSMPGTYPPSSSYVVHGTTSPHMNSNDLWSSVSDSHEYEYPAVDIALHSAETVHSAEEAFTGDLGANWVDMEWHHILGANAPEKPPSFGLDDMSRSAGHSSGSPTLFLESEAGGSDQSCTCFKRLTDHLCDLNIIERQQDIIPCDTMLQKANTIVTCTESVLSCHHCRLDSKILMLIMTVLQTVLNWVCVEHKQCKQQNARELPAVHFGDWKVPESDGLLIQGLLTSRVLVSFQSTVNMLRLRLDEIVLGASKTKRVYQHMDIDSLRHALQRLMTSLGELAGLAKPLRR